MRISTSMLYDAGTQNIQRHQSELSELQQKVAAGRRVLKPSDDPISAAGATLVRQAKGVNAQYATNAVNAQSALSQEDDALSQVTRVLQDVKTLTVSAGQREPPECRPGEHRHEPARPLCRAPRRRQSNRWQRTISVLRIAGRHAAVQ